MGTLVQRSRRVGDMTRPWLWSIGPGEAAPHAEDPLPRYAEVGQQRKRHLSGMTDQCFGVEAGRDRPGAKCASSWPVMSTTTMDTPSGSKWMPTA